MQPRQCAGCGASLPPMASRDGEDPVVICRFCGLTHAPASPTRVIDVTWKPGGGGALVRLVGWTGACLGLAAAVVGLVVAFGARPGRSGLGVITRPDVTAGASRDGVVALDGLADLPAGRRPLDVPPPPTGYAAFDVMTDATWALAIAQRWSSDAQLERIDVTKLTMAGVVNVSTDAEAEVRYRFVSPSAIRALRTHRATSTRATGITGLFLHLEGGRAHVQGTSTADLDEAEPAAFPTGLSTVALVPVLLQDARFRVPFLSGYLIHLEDEGWVWYLSTLDGQSLPRVRASDGVAWPYRASGASPTGRRRTRPALRADR